MKKLFIVLFFISLLFAGAPQECNSTASMLVPAVVGSGARLVNLSVTSFPGPGELFISIPPKIGTATQSSIENAAFYAFRRANRACNLLISFEKGSTSLIDGPSAGAAMSVMIYSAITGIPFRNDTVITGAIEGDSLGPVGGLYEKTRAAAKGGFKYMVTPLESVFERLLVEKLEERYNISVVETNNLDELFAFMFNNTSIPPRPLSLSLSSPDPSSLSPYPDEVERFAPLVDAMVAREREVVGGISNEELRSFFEEKIAFQRALKEKNYLFSAANDAFLSYIDARTVAALESGSVDIPREKGRIGICLSQIKRKAMTDENFEWIVGAQLREQWARDRLSLSLDEDALKIEQFILFNELAYGEAWCGVAKALYEGAPASGKMVDQAIWADIAYRKIEEARKLSPEGELLNRLIIAQNSYEKGLYGAAIYDAAFVISGIKAQAGEKPTATSFKNLWPRVYASHAAYLKAVGSEEGARRTLLFAEELEKATNEMSEAIPENKFNFMVGVAALSLLLSAVTIVALRHKKNRGMS